MLMYEVKAGRWGAFKARMVVKGWKIRAAIAIYRNKLNL